MGAIEYGMDIGSVRKRLSNSLDAVATRINRCTWAKNKAALYLKEVKPDFQNHGLNHFRKVIVLQQKGFARYHHNLGEAMENLGLIPRQMPALAPLEKGIFSGISFHFAQNKAVDSINGMKEGCESIRQSITQLQANLDAQKALLFEGGDERSPKSTESVDKSALLREFAEEEGYSREILAKVDECKNHMLRLLDAVETIQQDFVQFMLKLTGQGGSFLWKNIGNSVDVISKYLAWMYFVKIALLFGFSGIVLWAPTKETADFANRIVLVIANLDNVMDILSSSPAIKQSFEIAVITYASWNQKLRSLCRSVIASSQQAPSAVFKI